VFLTSGSDDAEAMINMAGGLSVELVQEVADAIKELSIKDQKEGRLREAAKKAYANAKSGSGSRAGVEKKAP
jgi:hypothetical protein